MKKLSRALLLAAGAILGLMVAALLAVNLYVQSQGTQARIQHELSQRLGTMLHIQRISVTPWAGLKLTGITMPQEPGAGTGEFLRADTFRLRIRLLSLFERRLIITEVSLVHPSVIWAQNANGKWRLPLTAPEAAAIANPESAVPIDIAPGGETQEPPAAAPVAPLRAVAKPRVETATPLETEPAAHESFTPEVRRVALSNGHFHFLVAKGKPIATVAGVNFRSSLRNGVALHGHASIAKISLRDRFFLEQLESPVRYDAAALDFSQIKSRSAGGEITGHFSMNPADPGSPFDVSVNFREVQADRLVTDAGGPAGMVQGQVEGHLTAAGKTADADALVGNGEIYLRDGQVRQYSLLTAVGELLQIDELKQLHFDQAQAKFHINPGAVTVDELLLTSPNIRLSAVGTIDFDSKLHLNAQLAISEKVRAQLFRAIRDNFQPGPDAGYSSVSFRVSGTIDRPKTNLMDRLVGGDLKSIGGVLNSLFGDKGPKKKKQPVAEPSQPADTAPAPAVSPPDGSP